MMAQKTLSQSRWKPPFLYNPLPLGLLASAIHLGEVQEAKQTIERCHKALGNRTRLLDAVNVRRDCEKCGHLDPLNLITILTANMDLSRKEVGV